MIPGENAFRHVFFLELSAQGGNASSFARGPKSVDPYFIGSVFIVHFQLALVAAPNHDWFTNDHSLLAHVSTRECSCFKYLFPAVIIIKNLRNLDRPRLIEVFISIIFRFSTPSVLLATFSRVAAHVFTAHYIGNAPICLFLPLVVAFECTSNGDIRHVDTTFTFKDVVLCNLRMLAVTMFAMSYD